MKILFQSMTSDEQLWRRSLAGDREAFGLIVERHQSLICALAYSACGDLNRSEDLAQETFLAAWRTLGELRDPGKLRSWLCGIVRQLTANALRRDYRRGIPESLEVVAEPASPGNDPAVQVITQEEATLLWRALASLPELYREPIVLFYREQQSITEVATGLELSEDVVRQRLSRGRTLLREEMMALVETTLTRTRPKAVFAIGVLAALPLASSTTASAAGISAITGKNAALTKGIFFGAGLGAFFGLIGGLFVGLLSTKAVEMTTRSERERICVVRHCHLIILSVFALCGLLVLTLIGAGEIYPATTILVTVGILIWVALLVGLVLLLNSRMQRDVLRIRTEDGNDDMPPAS